jgi:hypothetical protein
MASRYPASGLPINALLEANNGMRQTRRTPMDRTQKERMLMLLIRNRQVFDAFRNQLKPTDFDDFDRAYACIWVCTLRLFERYGQLPDEVTLIANIEHHVKTNWDGLNVTEAARINEFLNFAFDPNSFKRPIDDSGYTAWAIKTVKRFISEGMTAKLEKLAAERSVNIESIPVRPQRLPAQSISSAVPPIATSTR